MITKFFQILFQYVLKNINKVILVVSKVKFFGSGTLSGKMLLVRIVENDKILDYFRAGWVKQRLALPCSVRKDIRIGPCRVRVPSRG